MDKSTQCGNCNSLASIDYLKLLLDKYFLVVQQLVDLGLGVLPGKCRREIVWKFLDVGIVICHVKVLWVVTIALFTSILIKGLASLEALIEFFLCEIACPVV